MSSANLKLEGLGWNSFFEEQFVALGTPELTIARVIEELKGFYRVRSPYGEYLAEIAGKVRHQAESREDIPAVGDWVGITARSDEGRARINSILPRKTKLSRKVAGRVHEEQIVATNIDTVFVVGSLNRELNPRRIERYLTVVWESGAQPVVLLNKADLCDDSDARLFDVEQIAAGVPVHVLSAAQGTGLDAIWNYLGQGRTAAFVGSSGVGKSTLINALAGTQTLSTQSVRESDDRGRHTTTSRQMIFLPRGGIVIDTPGMRELGLWDDAPGAGGGVDTVFDDVAALAQGCKFRDCSHRDEPGCAVQAAVKTGALPAERLENYSKLQAELNFQERKIDPEKARETKEKWKQIHKAMRRDKPKG